MIILDNSVILKGQRPLILRVTLDTKAQFCISKNVKTIGQSFQLTITLVAQRN